VIHRDLKPGNILVSDEGEGLRTEDSGLSKDRTTDAPYSVLSPQHSVLSAQPKIIDFGVARATDSDVSSTRLATDVGQIVGTLQYMSPEQCDADPQNLDIRSDVYSLGLVLYELLCGQPPYDVSKSSLLSAVRTIREEAPRRLSSFGREMRGDLETLVLKALEKDRERRYSSAADMAQDIERFLKNRPIEARPPSTVYQFGKLVGRHKPLFAMLALLIVSLSALAIAMTVLYRRAGRERLRAERAETSWRSEATAAREVSAYLVNLFQSLDPWSAASSEESSGLPVMELLAREERSLTEKLKNQPLTQADVLTALATVYGRMEMYRRAESALRRVWELRRGELGSADPRVSEAAERLAEALRRRGEFAEAEPIVRESVAARRRNARDRGRPQESLVYPLTTLGLLCALQGRHEEAEAHYREAMELHRAVFGEEDPDLIGMVINLAYARRLAGDAYGCERIAREALDRCERLARPAPRFTISALSQLSFALQCQGRTAEAEAAMRRGIALSAETSGANSYATIMLRTSLASLMKSAGDLVTAEELYRQAYEQIRKLRGPDHPSAGSVLFNLLHVLGEKGDGAGLEEIEQEFLAQRQRALALPDDHPSRSGSALHLGQLRLFQDDPVGAEPLLSECVELRRAALSPTHWLTAYAEGVLGECLAIQRRYAEAEPLLLRAEQALRVQLGPGDERSTRTLLALVKLYRDWGREDKAAEAGARLQPAYSEPAG
jgi:tetratricopeptide (TPR) repeat protein